MRARRFFPLDEKLRLRDDHWSEGAARVAAREGLQAKSFDLAAEVYRDAVGGGISGDSVARITEGWGAQIDAKRAEEARLANAPAGRGDDPDERRPVAINLVAGRANISTDGAMVLTREEGWKEAKLTAVSAVEVLEGAGRAAKNDGASRRENDLLVRLTEHSYQAGIWNADTMCERQYAEGLRRGLDQVEKLSSVNDGALWIERITATNFPEAVQIVDWGHAGERLWMVGKAVFGEGTAGANEWTEEQLDKLWDGDVASVVRTLAGMELVSDRYPDVVRQTPGYFGDRVDRMRYEEYRAAGYPIGSGTVESGANTVIHHRMKRPGRGWKLDNAQAMLAALSELKSGRFDLAWQATLPEAA